eukprot:9171605-Alexandrium_andersonii.AAC.1
MLRGAFRAPHAVCCVLCVVICHVRGLWWAVGGVTVCGGWHVLCVPCACSVCCAVVCEVSGGQWAVSGVAVCG